jgi:hypothetical protein
VKVGHIAGDVNGCCQTVATASLPKTSRHAGEDQAGSIDFIAQSNEIAIAPDVFDLTRER